MDYENVSTHTPDLMYSHVITVIFEIITNIK